MFIQKGWLLKRQPPTKKHCFTLLEIFVALSILVLIGAVCSIPLNSFLQRHRVSLDTQTLQCQLEKLREFALLYQAEVSIDLTQSSKGLSCEYTCDEVFPFSKAVILKSIRKFAYKKRPVSHLQLHFHADGSASGAGTLSFYQGEEEDSFSQSIEFPQIKTSKNIEKKQKPPPKNPNY